MKVACLILTHTSALQIQRLVKRLDNVHFDFYIHVDKKVDIEPYRKLLKGSNIFFAEKRRDITWAGYSGVQAVFDLLDQLEASGNAYDFISFHTGQDYPLKSADYIIDFLQKNKGKQFIHYMDFDEWTGAQRRIDKHHLQELNIVGKFYIQKLVHLLVPKRKAPKDIKIYGYSAYWTLSMDCALYVAKYVKENPTLRHYFKYTFGSDEFVYQTVIMNSHYKDAVVNNNFRYIDWSAGGMNPKFLKVEDIEKLKASDCLFARKLNVDIDSEVFDLIDDYADRTLKTLKYQNNSTPFTNDL